MLKAKHTANGTVIFTITGAIPDVYAQPGHTIKQFALIIVDATDNAPGINGIECPARK